MSINWTNLMYVFGAAAGASGLLQAFMVMGDWKDKALTQNRLLEWSKGYVRWFNLIVFILLVVAASQAT